MDTEPITRAPLSRRKKVIFSAVVLVAVLLVAEFACRLLGGAPPIQVDEDLANWKREWQNDFYLVMPGGDINQDGVRDRQHPITNPDNRYRIICLGDSVTFGYSLPPSDSYSSALERMLMERTKKVEVFNVALPGWSTRQEAIAYQEVARKYKPHQVILGVCLNDIAEMQNNLAKPQPVFALAYRHSSLVRTLFRPARWEIQQVGELFEDEASHRVQSAWELFVAELTQLASEVEQDGAELTVLAFPFRLQVDPDAPPPTPQRKLRRICAQNNIGFLDVLPVLRSKGRAAFVDYDHLSRLGGELVAREIIASCPWIEAIPDEPARAVPSESDQ